MDTSILVDIISDNAHGVRVRYLSNTKPSVCPGLGGWKSEEDRMGFVTTIKHPHCQSIREAIMLAPFSVKCAFITMRGSNIVGVRPSN